MEKTESSLIKAVIKKYFNKKDVLLWPNILCYIRVILMIFFSVSYILSFEVLGNKFAYVYISCAIMALAEYTDFLDGFIARKFNMTSNLGKALDPICDKLSLLCIGVALTFKFYEFGLVIALVSLYVFKELWMTLSAFILALNGKTYKQSRWFGKMSTFICYFTLGLMLIGGPFLVDYYSVNGVHEPPAYYFINILSIISMIFLSFALVAYTIYFIKILKNKELDISVDTSDDKS